MQLQPTYPLSGTKQIKEKKCFIRTPHMWTKNRAGSISSSIFCSFCGRVSLCSAHCQIRQGHIGWRRTSRITLPWLALFFRTFFDTNLIIPGRACERGYTYWSEKHCTSKRDEDWKTCISVGNGWKKIIHRAWKVPGTGSVHGRPKRLGKDLAKGQEEEMRNRTFMGDSHCKKKNT
jgi:hypothetical protein